MENDNLVLGDLPESLTGDFEEEEFNSQEENTSTSESPPEESAGEGANQETETSEEGTDTQPENFIIPRDKFAETFEELMSRDSDFAREVSTRVGNKAKARYQPQIDERDRRIAHLEAQLKAQEFSKIPDTELTDKLKNDKEFRAEYDRTQEALKTPETPQYNPLQEFLSITISEAQAQGFNDEDLEVFKQRIEEGKYFVDETGHEYTAAEWRLAAGAMHRDIMELTNARRASRVSNNSSEEIKVKETKAPENQNSLVDSPGPVLSTPGSRGSQTHRYTLAEVKNMTPDEKFRIWPTDEAYERALISGEILLPDDVKIEG